MTKEFDESWIKNPLKPNIIQDSHAKNQKLFNINLFTSTLSTELIWKEQGTYKKKVRYLSKKDKQGSYYWSMLGSLKKDPKS